MYTFRRFTKKQIFLWTFRDIIYFFIVSSWPVAIYYFFCFEWMIIPTLPVALLGTAVAFNIGFKNNNAYDRVWEARKIYGGIVNSSRTLGILTLDFINNHFTDNPKSEEELYEIRKRIIYRHIAWLTALRYQLRQPKPWEHHNHKDIKKFKEKKGHVVDEENIELSSVLIKYVSENEMKDVLGRINTATHLIKNQSKDIAELHNLGLLDDFRHMEFKNILEEFYTLQGKSERIKNFPLPRQYASISYYFVMLFTVLVPFSMLGAFEANDWHVWFAIPFSMMVSWVFFTMEKIGDYSENPFEGTGNDVPITSLSRTIEIDLRDMLDEKDLPAPITGKNGVVI
jgi:putative membrane protein